MKITAKELKKLARQTRKEIENGQKPSHSKMLSIIARAMNFPGWEALCAALESTAEKLDEKSALSALTGLGDFYPDLCAEGPCIALHGKTFEVLTSQGHVLHYEQPTAWFMRDVSGLSTEQGDAPELRSDLAQEDREQGERVFYTASMKQCAESSVVLLPHRVIKAFLPDFRLDSPDDLVLNATQMEQLPIRRELMAHIWKLLLTKVDFLTFVSASVQEKEQWLAPILESLPFTLTAAEQRGFAENQVYDDSLAHEIFVLEANRHRKAELGDAEPTLFSDMLYETFGQDLEYVQKIAKESPYRVWTWIECDADLVLAQGYHLVNRQAYFISQKECPVSVEFWDTDMPVLDDEYDDESSED